MHQYGPTQCATNLAAYLIFHEEKTKYKRATYVSAVFDIRLQKIETHITILTAGGNPIYYTG